MTKQEYETYKSRVQQFLSCNSVKPGCYGQTECNAEPYFSWRPCECCGSRLGGDREDYTFAIEEASYLGQETSEIEASICQNCVYYLAYGQLDDMTMMEMEGAEV